MSVPNFWTLVGFEYKKLFLKKSVLIALVFAFGLIIFSCFTMVIGRNRYGNYYTKNMSAYEVMLMDKGYAKALTGRPLDGSLIIEASKAYQKIDNYVGKYTESEEYQKYARPYSSVYTLIDAAYVKPGRAFNIDDFQNISEEDANNYYTIRKKQYRTNLENNPLFSPSDIEKVMQLDTNVQKPFIMHYSDGYQRFFALSLITMAILLFSISFCLSPIFSNEYSKQMDSLILTSKNGRKTFLHAKLFMSISFSFFLSLLFIFSAYFVCMGIYGFEGTHAQIQLLLPAITYNFTMLDVTLLLIITSLFGAFLHTGICMFISAFSKNPIIPMTITSILILAGMSNIGSNSVFFMKARYFLPSTMGSFFDITTQLVFTIFNIQFMLYQMACLIAAILGILFFIVAVQRFKRHQVV